MRIVFVSLVLAACTPSAAPCPSLPNVPRATLELSPGLGEGTYDVKLAAGDAAETCTITVGKPDPAVNMGGMVRSPMTQTSTTCVGLAIEGIHQDGTVGALRVPGTPKSVRVELSRAGKPVAQVSATPDYTPDHCGFVRPLVPMTVAP